MKRVRRALARRGLLGGHVTFEHDDLGEVLAEHACGEQPRETAAQDDGALLRLAIGVADFDLHSSLPAAAGRPASATLPGTTRARGRRRHCRKRFVPTELAFSA